VTFTNIMHQQFIFLRLHIEHSS